MARVYTWATVNISGHLWTVTKIPGSVSRLSVDCSDLSEETDAGPGRVGPGQSRTLWKQLMVSTGCHSRLALISATQAPELQAERMPAGSEHRGFSFIWLPILFYIKLHIKSHMPVTLPVLD